MVIASTMSTTVDEELIELFAGIAVRRFFVASIASSPSLRIPAASRLVTLFTSGRQREGEQEDHDADGHGVAIRGRRPSARTCRTGPPRMAPLGPPLVMALTNRKAMLMVEMMKKVRVVRMLVQIRGMVIWKNCFTRPAPSRLARFVQALAARLAMEAMYMTM